DRDLADRVGHACGCDRDHTAGSLLGRAQPELLERVHGEATVEHDAAGELAWPEHPERERCIGDGGLGAAAAVARRSRPCSGAARADSKQAADVDICDRAAAGADRADVDPRGLHGQPDDRALVEELRAALDDQAGVEARAADVRRDRIADPELAREPGCALRSGYRPGPERLERPAPCPAEAHRSPSRARDESLAGEAELP